MAQDWASEEFRLSYLINAFGDEALAAITRYLQNELYPATYEAAHSEGRMEAFAKFELRSLRYSRV